MSNSKKKEQLSIFEKMSPETIFYMIDYEFTIGQILKVSGPQIKWILNMKLQADSFTKYAWSTQEEYRTLDPVKTPSLHECYWLPWWHGLKQVWPKVIKGTGM